MAKSNSDIAHGNAHAFHANQKPTHAFNETSLEMKDKMNPLDSPNKYKIHHTHFSKEDSVTDASHHLESVAHEEGRKAAEAIAKSKEGVAHGISLAPNATCKRPAYQFNESSNEMKDKMNPLDPPRNHAPHDAK